MNVYELTNNGRKDYDHCNAMVVGAESEERARKLASEHAVGEGAATWLDPVLSSCELLAPTAGGVIIRDVSWG